MEIESITYNYTEKTLVVTLIDGATASYDDRASYLADWPDREADCVAIGWE